MRTALRFSAAAFVAVLLLGNGQCHSDDGSPSFVTTLTIEDANGVPDRSFFSGEEIKFVLSVKNRTETSQTVVVAGCYPDAFFVVKAGTSDVVFNGDENPHCLNGAPGSLVFNPGESMRFTTTWHQEETAQAQLVPPGSYEVMGGLTCTDDSQCVNFFGLAPDQMGPAQYRSTLVSFTIH